MKFFNKINLNKGFTPTPTFTKQSHFVFNKQYKSGCGGFTLIETMIAVFILTTALASLLNLTSSSLFTSKYANNEIIANYLLQESVDYIRNDRDSVAFQQVDYVGGGWDAFIAKYNYCFSPDGCTIEATETLTNNIIKPCQEVSIVWGTLRCPVLRYDASASASNYKNFYNYDNTIQKSNFNRRIRMSHHKSNPDEIDVTVTIEWLNGNLVRSRSLQSSLLNW